MAKRKSPARAMPRSKAKAQPKKKYEHKYPENVTEEFLTAELTPELRDAWRKLKAYAASIGPQRIYASGWAIMFSRKVCYAFVRPKKTFLELVFFLPRAERTPLVRSVRAASKTKFAHTVKVVHEDQVEDPLTDWLREAYEFAPGEGP